MDNSNGQSLKQLLERQGSMRGAELMAIFPDDETTLTYGELADGARRWAGHLKERGLTNGSHVTLVAKKSRQFLLAYFGALLLGATVHVVDDRVDEKDMRRALNMFEPQLILRDKFGRNRISDDTDFDAEIGELVGLDALDDHSGVIEEVPGETPAICVFTSGSTGDPKGILSSHDNLLFAGGCLAVHGLSPDDRVLGLTPLSGTNGQVFSVWAPLVSGGSTVLYQGMFSSFLALDWAAEHHVTWINGTPTYLALFMANKVDRAEFALDSVRFFRSASAPLPLNVLDAFETHYEIPIVETMGLSEMSGQVFANPVEPDLRKLGSVGQPYRSDLRIMNDNRDVVSQGQIGELEVRSDGLMLGYYQDDNATSQAIVDGWLRTGDLGSQDEDGFVFIKGRKKDIAIIGGKNVSLREIDDELYRLPGVQFATCFGIPDDGSSGEAIVAILQLQPGAGHDATELQQLLKADLASYMRPRELLIWDALPTGGAGKILRARAKALYLEKEIK